MRYLIDRLLARIVYWSDQMFKDKEPLSFLGRVSTPFVRGIGLVSTEAELAVRRKEQRRDRAYMSKMLLKCISGQRWRRAIRLVALADRKTQRILLERFIAEGKIVETIQVSNITGIKLEDHESACLSHNAMINYDQDRLPYNGRRPLEPSRPYRSNAILH